MILYICSTLERTGPTNQLLNIVSELPRSEFFPIIMTLSKERNNSMMSDFLGHEVKVICLGSKSQTYFTLRNEVKDIITKYDVFAIHTQGIRADSIVASIGFKNWIATLRNVPYLDYPSHYGWIGYPMSLLHIFSLRFCSKLVLVSNANHKSLEPFISSTSRVINNGVDLRKYNFEERNRIFEGGVIKFIYTGLLESRKNIALMLDFIHRDKRFHLTILGQGDLHELVLSHPAYASGQVEIVGYVNDVRSYLKASDIFIMLSKSEGYPNSAMEAYSMGLPLILSKIAPHEELSAKCMYGVELLDINNPNFEDFKYSCLIDWLNKLDFSRFKSISNDVLSSTTNSKHYQELYREQE